MNTKAGTKTPECPECGSKDTGCETKGEWFCYDCGNQWNQGK